MTFNRILTITLAVLIVAVAGFIVFTVANAEEHGPVVLQPTYVTEDGQEVYIFQAGTRTCVRVGDQLECFCNCDSTVCNVPTVLLTPEVTPEVTPTNGGPTATPTPVEPTLTPTDPGPEPTEKPKCNRGIGNLSEDCDPGNSFGQGQGGGRPAGEDRDEEHGAPPPNRGGGKP